MAADTIEAMPEAAFVLPVRHDPSLRALVQTVRYELELQAVNSTLTVGHFPEVRPGRVYVLVDPCAYVAAGEEDALPEDSVLRGTIFLLAERPPAASDMAHQTLLRRGGDLFAFDPRTRLALERLELPCRLLRPGFSASLDRFDPDAERPIDLAFVGARSERRAHYLARAADVLDRHHSVVELTEPEPYGSEPGTTSAEVGPPVLAQTKIALNLHAGPEAALEWHRVVDAVHAGAVVVSEHAHGFAPLIPGEHVLVGSADAVPYVAETLLRDPTRLAHLRVAAHERLRSWLPFAFPVAVLRAALVELVGEPVAADASLGTPQS
jgi:hypothetical protein